MNKLQLNTLVNDALDTDTLISVGIPCFNHAEFIVDTLESIYESDWPKLEILLIDDGSSDNSYEIALAWTEEHKDRFFRVHVERQKNIGLCKTLNRLYFLADGDFFAVIASDDKLDPDSLSVRASALASSQNADAVYSDSRFMTQDGKLLNETLHNSCNAHSVSLLSRNFQFSELLLCWSGGGPGLMLRRQSNRFSELGPFCEDLPYEDLEFYLRLSIEGRLIYLPQVLQSYRIVEQSFSRSKDKKKILILGCQQALIKILPLAGFYNKTLIKLKLFRLKADSWEPKLLNRILRIASGAMCTIIRKLHRLTAAICFRLANARKIRI